MREGERFAVVTGATSGIGRSVALGLARAGLRPILIGRSRERLANTAVAIAAAGQSPILIRADLSSLRETAAAAAEVLDQVPALDVLVNNAGILSPRRTETDEGHETTLAVNHLAPFVLTRALLPALRASGRGRVVQTGSSTSDQASIDPDDLELRRGWRMTRAYARSKLALLMVAIELAAAERDRGVDVNVVHPGLVATDLVRAGGIDQWVWRHILSRMALSPEQGADTLLHAALSPDFAGISGCYLKKRAPVLPNRRALDPGLRARVLAATERLAGAA
ncbi:SDR family NAD(P)-dependent oxidoreductase [Acetobacteraceae bacterium KSS8]|uniref:SDR family NAD(P)-dependent oxidoreductase n=1 Tax=Endosaccharibacter trunci TaxID=2812733 RepID=A0ABT1W2N6_9PROT|nr:SDR family NAD(P)-dependent oxidoreductase [Acetobacteraceae bacterium KSS8]